MLRAWLKRGWRVCQDVGEVPRYLRCMRCYRLVTHGQIQTGGCACGFRKLNPCRSLTMTEALLLKLGWFPLKDWERQSIGPIAPCMTRVRAKVTSVN